MTPLRECVELVAIGFCLWAVVSVGIVYWMLSDPEVRQLKRFVADVIRGFSEWF